MMRRTGVLSTPRSIDPRRDGTACSLSVRGSVRMPLCNPQHAAQETVRHHLL